MDDLLQDISLHLEALYEANNTSAIVSHEATLLSIFQDIPAKATQAFTQIIQDTLLSKLMLQLTDEKFSIFVVAQLHKCFDKIVHDQPYQKSSLQNHVAMQMIFELADQILNPALCQPAFETLWKAAEILIHSLDPSYHPSFAIRYLEMVKEALNKLIKDAKSMALESTSTLKLEPSNIQAGLRQMQILGRMISLTSEKSLFRRDEEPLENLLLDSFELILFLGKELIQEYVQMMPIYNKTYTLKADSPHVETTLNYTLVWVRGILHFLRGLEMNETLFTGVRQFFINNKVVADIFSSLVTFDNTEPVKRTELFERGHPRTHLITHKYKTDINDMLNELRRTALQVISVLLLIDQQVEPYDEQSEQENSQLLLSLPEIEKHLTSGLYSYFMSLDVENKEQREDAIESRLFYLNQDQSPQVYDIILHSVMIIRARLRLLPPNIIDQFQFYKRLAVGALLPLFVTTPKERETMLQDPSQFVNLCQDICEHQQSMNLKSQAALLLQNFVDNCYEMKVFILRFTIDLCKNALASNSSKLPAQLKKYQDYPIVSILPSKIQLDISLMVFSILSFLFQSIEATLEQLNALISAEIEALVNHPFLVIRVKFLLLLEYMYDLLFQNDKRAQSIATKFLLASYTQQTDCENKQESLLLQLMAINSLNEVLEKQQAAAASLEPHMLLIFESMLHNIEHCDALSFFQQIDNHVSGHVTQMIETKLCDLTDTEAETPLLLEIIHSYAVRMARDMKGPCFDRIHESFKSFFAEDCYTRLWEVDGVIGQIEAWGQRVFEIHYEEVREEIILTLALALGRCNEGTHKFHLESLQFLRYFMKYLDYHLKKGDDLEKGLLKPEGMSFIQSLSRSQESVKEIDDAFDSQGGFLELIIGKMGFDLMSMGGVRTFEEGITILLDVLMTSGEKMNEEFLIKMMEFFTLGKESISSHACQQLVSYCYMGCALAQPQLCLKFIASNGRILKEFSDMALSDKQTVHQHGLTAIGICMLLKSERVGQLVELKEIARWVVVVIKCIKEMKRIAEENNSQEDKEEEEDEDVKGQEEEKYPDVEEVLNQDDRFTPIAGYFQKSSFYSKIFSVEEALDCLRAALHSLNSSSKIGGEMLKNKLGKGTMQDLDDLLHSETVHKQVRRIFKATRQIISKHKPMRLIEEIMK